MCWLRRGSRRRRTGWMNGRSSMGRAAGGCPVAGPDGTCLHGLLAANSSRASGPRAARNAPPRVAGARAANRPLSNSANSAPGENAGRRGSSNRGLGARPRTSAKGGSSVAVANSQRMVNPGRSANRDPRASSARSESHGRLTSSARRGSNHHSRNKTAKAVASARPGGGAGGVVVAAGVARRLPPNRAATSTNWRKVTGR